jgi:hypothetical protein
MENNNPTCENIVLPRPLGAIEEIDKKLEGVSQLVSHIENKLRPVLNQNSPKSTEVETTKVLLCSPLIESLAATDNIVARLLDDLEGLLSRIDL